MKNMINLHQIDKKQIIQKSAEFLINYLRLYHNITQKTLLLLSGGSTVGLYKLLAEFIEKSDLDWKFLTIAQVDERFFGTYNIQSRLSGIHDTVRLINSPTSSGHITFNKEDINAYQIKKTGLWEVCRKKKIPYFVVSQEGTIGDSAEEYNNVLEKLIKECVYKIAVLGIGEDGHTAGLLPGYERSWNMANLVAGYENSGRFKQRISITPKAIKMLDQVIVVASGEKKREVIKHLTYNIKHKKTFNRKQTTEKMELDEFPAIILREIPQVDLFVDWLE